MSAHRFSNAFYAHPAFIPHHILKGCGISGFFRQNLIVVVLFIGALTYAAWRDGSFFLGARGYGYLEHPGMLGWYIIQLWMPVTLYGLVRKAATSKDKWKRIATANGSELNETIVELLFAFVGFKTKASRALFALLFTIGFGAFAWNSFQNAHPGGMAPLEFWDSINFRSGYIVSRVHKFYLNALLLPSAVHLFTAVVWVQFRRLRRFTATNSVRIAPFDADRCGGLGFLSEMVLAPAITAILISGIVLFGAIYTHRILDVSTAMGAGITLAVFVIFYLLPTFSLSATIRVLKRRESDLIHDRQDTYYKSILSGNLHGDELGEAKDYLEYFDEVRQRIDSVPTFPHFAPVFGALSFAVVLPMLTAFVNLSSALAKTLIAQP